MSTNFEDLVLRDIAANRPTAGKPGRLFYDTTNSKLQRDNGSSWDDVEPTASSYTDEQAQDAIGAMIGETDTVDLTYTDATPLLKGDVKKQMSITSDSSGLKLDGDSATPGNNKVYGTDGSGVKGWKADPAGSSGPAGLLGYTQITSSFTTSSTSFTDVTSLSVTVTVGSRAIKITAFSGSLDSASGRIFIIIYDVTGSAQIAQSFNLQSGGNGSPGIIIAKVAPAAGSRTYKVQMKVESGTGRMYAAADSPSFIMVEEI
jgi:hypothetical protein